MDELVSPQAAEAIVRGVAAALIAVGMIGGALGAIWARPRRAALALGALIALAGGLVYTLWVVYNGIIVAFGLDSVKALLVNLGIFTAVGAAYGVLAAGAWRWATRQTEAGEK